MRNLTIRRSANIDASFTADEWELYLEPGRDEAAAELNKALMDAVNAPGSTAQSVDEAMSVVQRRHDGLGADDSEPQHLVDRIIEQVFG